MKKYSAIIFLLCVIFCFSGCKNLRENETKTLNTTKTLTESSTTENITTEEAETLSVEAITKAVTTVADITEEETTKPFSETYKESTAEPTELQTTAETSENESVCTIEINCKTVLNNKNDLKKRSKDKVPSDGVILETVTASVKDGDTVLDVLLYICEENGVEVSYTDMPLFNSCYIEGIGGLYEKDCGSASGWMYSVNGVFPQKGANTCTVSAGDKIVFMYTCDGGMDVGDR